MRVLRRSAVFDMVLPCRCYADLLEGGDEAPFAGRSAASVDASLAPEGAAPSTKSCAADAWQRAYIRTAFCHRQQPFDPLGSDPSDHCSCSVFGRVGTMGALFAQLAACCDEFAKAGSGVIAAASTRSFLGRNPGARVNWRTRMGVRPLRRIDLPRTEHQQSGFIRI